MSQQTSERHKRFEVFAELFKTATTVYYDFTNDTFSIYLGDKTGDQMLADEANWLMDEGPNYLLNNRYGIDTPWSAGLIVVAAAIGKDIVVTNFSNANLIFWQNFQTGAEKLAAELGNTAGKVTFEPKSDDYLSEEEQAEKIFLENFAQKPTLYYDPGLAQFFIYFGTGKPLEEDTEAEDWTTIMDERLQEILGYIAGGYTDHATIMLAAGYDIEILLNEEKDVEKIVKEHFADLKEANKYFFPIDELKGKLKYFMRKKKDSKTE